MTPSESIASPAKLPWLLRVIYNFMRGKTPAIRGAILLAIFVGVALIFALLDQYVVEDIHTSFDSPNGYEVEHVYKYTYTLEDFLINFGIVFFSLLPLMLWCAVFLPIKSPEGWQRNYQRYPKRQKAARWVTFLLIALMLLSTLVFLGSVPEDGQSYAYESVDTYDNYFNLGWLGFHGDVWSKIQTSLSQFIFFSILVSPLAIVLHIINSVVFISMTLANTSSARAQKTLEKFKRAVENADKVIDTSDFEKRLESIETRLGKKDLEGALQILYEAKEQLKRALSEWRPILNASLPIKIDGGGWERTNLVIRNDGRAHCRNIGFEMEGVECRGILEINFLRSGEEREMDIALRASEIGIVPVKLRMSCSRADRNTREVFEQMVFLDVSGEGLPMMERRAVKAEHSMVLGDGTGGIGYQPHIQKESWKCWVGTLLGGGVGLSIGFGLIPLVLFTLPIEGPFLIIIILLILVPSCWIGGFYGGYRVGKYLQEQSLLKMGVSQMSVAKYTGCYIATAVYGTPLAPEIEILREFRDRRMEERTLGRFLIGVYYQSSPQIADYIRNKPLLKKFIRNGFVEPAVKVSKHLLR